MIDAKTSRCENCGGYIYHFKERWLHERSGLRSCFIDDENSKMASPIVKSKEELEFERKEIEIYVMKQFEDAAIENARRKAEHDMRHGQDVELHLTRDGEFEIDDESRPPQKLKDIDLDTDYTYLKEKVDE